MTKVIIPRVKLGQFKKLNKSNGLATFYEIPEEFCKNILHIDKSNLQLKVYNFCPYNYSADFIKKLSAKIESKTVYLNEKLPLPDKIILPEAIVYDEDKKFIGNIKSYPKNVETLDELIRRNRRQLKTDDIYNILLKVSQDLETFHQNKINIINLNPLDILVDLNGNLTYSNIENSSVDGIEATMRSRIMLDHRDKKKMGIREDYSYDNEALTLLLLLNCFRYEAVPYSSKDDYLARLSKIKKNYNLDDTAYEQLAKLKDNGAKFDYVHNYMPDSMPKKLIKK